MQSRPKDSTTTLFVNWLTSVKCLSMSLEKAAMEYLLRLENADKTPDEIAKQRAKSSTFSAVYDRLAGLKLATRFEPVPDTSQKAIGNYFKKA